jgi:hypothetical protein
MSMAGAEESSLQVVCRHVVAHNLGEEVTAGFDGHQEQEQDANEEG